MSAMFVRGAAVALCLVSGPVLATEVPVPPPVQEQPAAVPALAAPVVWTLPANAELTLTPNSDLSSKSLKQGDTFAVSTVYDVLMNNHIVIPKGTRGQGKIAWRTGKGAFGKSAKMDIAFEWLDLGGRRIGIDGKHRQEGSGNTAATIGTAIAAGVFSAFVTGKSATIPHGMHLKAFTTEPVSFSPEGLAAAPTTATLVPVGGPAIAQGTSPAVAAASSPDHSQ